MLKLAASTLIIHDLSIAATAALIRQAGYDL
jgi:hypothetical protein